MTGLNPTKPIITLSTEQQDRLKQTGEDVARAEHAVEVLKSLGMDTRELEDKLNWAKKVKEVLLGEFAK